MSDKLETRLIVYNLEIVINLTCFWRHNHFYAAITSKVLCWKMIGQPHLLLRAIAKAIHKIHSFVAHGDPKGTITTQLKLHCNSWRGDYFLAY